MAIESRYTEGICGNGAAILKDGVIMTISEILEHLNDYEQVIAKMKELQEEK